MTEPDLFTKAIKCKVCRQVVAIKARQVSGCDGVAVAEVEEHTGPPPCKETCYGSGASLTVVPVTSD